MLLVAGLVALTVSETTVAADPPFVGKVAPLSAKALSSAAPIGSVVLNEISGSSCSARASMTFSSARG